MPLPFTPGVEGAGVVDSVGDGVTGVAAGDRVVYVMTPGSYAELALVPAAHLVHHPGGDHDRGRGRRVPAGPDRPLPGLFHLSVVAGFDLSGAGRGRPGWGCSSRRSPSAAAPA